MSQTAHHQQAREVNMETIVLRLPRRASRTSAGRLRTVFAQYSSGNSWMGRLQALLRSLPTTQTTAGPDEPSSLKAHFCLLHSPAEHRRRWASCMVVFVQQKSQLGYNLATYFLVVHLRCEQRKQTLEKACPIFSGVCSKSLFIVEFELSMYTAKARGRWLQAAYTKYFCHNYSCEPGSFRLESRRGEVTHIFTEYTCSIEVIKHSQ